MAVQSRETNAFKGLPSITSGKTSMVYYYIPKRFEATVTAFLT